VVLAHYLGQFTRRIVGLDGFGLDDDGCVAALPCLGTGCDTPRYVARLESKGNRYAGHNRGSHGNDDLVDFFFLGHNCVSFLVEHEGQYTHGFRNVPVSSRFSDEKK
jgi:hypothetical protein